MAKDEGFGFPQTSFCHSSKKPNSPQTLWFRLKKLFDNDHLPGSSVLRSFKLIVQHAGNRQF